MPQHPSTRDQTWAHNFAGGDSGREWHQNKSPSLDLGDCGAAERTKHTQSSQGTIRPTSPSLRSRRHGRCHPSAMFRASLTLQQ